MKQLEMLYEGKAKQVFRTDDPEKIIIRYTDAATAFNNIKKEFASGKTLTASVKAGYKKSLGFTIDVHAILVLASLALWLIVTGPAKFASLVFLLCIAASAVCTLLVTRFYFYMFSAQPKNKIAFAGFKREETEDE